MTAALRPRVTAKPVVVAWLCRRCNRPCYRPLTECFSCRMAADKVWPGIGPLAGEAGGE